MPTAPWRRPSRRHPVDPFPGALALVTGAGHGIGRATAQALAAAGASVIATDVDGDAAAKTAADVGGTAHAVDVRDEAALGELAASIHEELGPLDILVNNAGVGLSARFLETSPDDWDWILGINLRGVINGCRAFGPAMVERGRGHVVNVSSGLGYMPRADQVGYVTAKAGVLELSRSLRADWRREGVGVSVICPGVINTGIVHRTRYRGTQADDEVVAGIQRIFSRGHPPTKVADAILRAVRTDRAVVPVGPEARVTWWTRGLLPAGVVDLIAGAPATGPPPRTGGDARRAGRIGGARERR